MCQYLPYANQPVDKCVGGRGGFNAAFTISPTSDKKVTEHSIDNKLKVIPI
jgi:hypothetical protein